MRGSLRSTTPSCSRDRRTTSGACARRGKRADRTAGGRPAPPASGPLPGQPPPHETPGWHGLRLHVDVGLAVGAVLASQERDDRKSDHPLDRACRVSHHGGPPPESNNSRVVGPATPSWIPRYLCHLACTSFISEAPDYFGHRHLQEKRCDGNAEVSPQAAASSYS